LLKVLARERSVILQRLLKDSIFQTEDKFESRIEKVFEGIADNQHRYLDNLFKKVEGSMTSL